MATVEQKRAIKEFIERWKAADGNEDQESQKFWFEFCQDVLGVKNPTRILDFEQHARGRQIDVLLRDTGVLIEQKSRSVGLDDVRHTATYGDETAYDQARWYYDHLIQSQKPRWIVTCNFDEFRIYNMNEEYPERTYTTVMLDELASKSHLFGFFVDQSESRLTIEKDLSVKAGALVGKLYDELAKQYVNLETDPQEQRSLNIVIVRLVWLLYAEDAGLLQEHQAFLKYMKNYSAADSRSALADLFRILDTPLDQRSAYEKQELLDFPYVNGGLFAARDVIIPQFTDQIRLDLLAEASAGFDWSGISPTIFGAVFESTLNPETRRSGGMHYTSIENIHKVIDPLFLDDLKAELAEIEGERVIKNRELRLKQLKKKISSIDVFDPACGSGNFLTETYMELRRLENRVLEWLNVDSGGAPRIAFEHDERDTIEVNIGQLHGIEINDFAVSVAKTALWIAEAQMMSETSEIIYKPMDFLPLKSNANIVCGNALRMDWNEVLPAEECNYIIGNPPFVGSSYCSASQKAEIVDLFGKIKLSNSLDYVAGWYYKACEMMQSNDLIRAALVSTNSITQGEQVAPLWGTLFERFDIHIDFAWKTFIWDSEAAAKAHVHCVIIGFSSLESVEKRLFDENGCVVCNNISPYLTDTSTAFVVSRGTNLCGMPKISHGSKPSDGGHLILSPEEKTELLKKEPGAAPYVKRYSGGVDFLRNGERYCLWLKDASPDEIESLPLVKQRVDAVKCSRLKSSAKATQQKANTPHLFFTLLQPDSGMMLVGPQVSSGRRRYIPFGFFSSDVIVSDKLLVMADADLYIFGVMESSFHNAWVRVVAGRLKSDFTYSVNVVYNNFVFPNPTSAQRQAIETCAQAVLDARDNYPDKSLADLYDPDKMPADLLAAHKALDAAVEAAYGVDFDGDEEKIVAHLFKLYAEATAGE